VAGWRVFYWLSPLFRLVFHAGSLHQRLLESVAFISLWTLTRAFPMSTLNTQLGAAGRAAVKDQAANCPNCGVSVVSRGDPSNLRSAG